MSVIREFSRDARDRLQQALARLGRDALPLLEAVARDPHHEYAEYLLGVKSLADCCGHAAGHAAADVHCIGSSAARADAADPAATGFERERSGKKRTRRGARGRRRNSDGRTIADC